MLGVPFGTDAWARAFPYATVGLIAANFAVAALLGFPDGSDTGIDQWVLRYGEFNLIQWFTCAFTHLDWFHVIGNMIFLWAFGFIVEGLLGWRWFLVLYAALAAAGGAVTQILMLGGSDFYRGAAGASGVITALMVVAALWAPRSNVKVLFVFLPIIRVWEMTVLRFCGLSIVLELIWYGLILSFAGPFMTSELLHLIGAAAGLGAGLLALHHKWVETGGWDVVSLRTRNPIRRSIAPRDPRVVAVEKIRAALDAGDAAQADEAYRAAVGWVAPRATLARLVETLFAAGRRDLALPRLEELVQAHPSPSLRLKLARELLRAGRPTAAREHLDRLASATLTGPQQALRARLERLARERQATGGLELE